MTKQYTDPDGNVLKADSGQDASGQYVAVKLGGNEICRFYQASSYALDDFEFGPSVKIGDNTYQGQMFLLNNCVEQFQVIEHQDKDEAGNITGEWTETKPWPEPKPILDPDTKQQIVLRESGYFTYTVTPQASTPTNTTPKTTTTTTTTTAPTETVASTSDSSGT